jgi:predicted DNA-binding protein
MARENTEHLTIRMPASQVARLDALAEKMGLTRSQLLRRLVVAPLRT